MTAYYDFFRYVKLYSPDGTTLEQTIEADNVTDSINFIRGNGVAWNSVDLATDTFKFDVEYNLSVPLSTTAIRLTDVNNVSSDINLVAGGNMIITRDNANQMTIAALVGGVSKSISNITAANPVVVTTTNAHAFTDGTEVTLVDVVGMTNVNGNEYFMDVLTSTTFALYSDAQLTTSIDGTGFSAYTSGGVATADYGGAKNAFKTIQVSGASPVVADNIQDILNLTGGTGIDITTTPGTDTIEWAIDSTVTTLVGSQTLTNKTLTSPIIAAIKPSASNSWALPDSNDTFVGKATTDTLTNKSVNLANNTLTTTIAQLNTAVSDESVVARDTTDTLTNKSISLTDNTVTGTIAELNTAVSDETVVGRDTTDTLTNKSIDLTDNTVTGTFAEFNTAVSDETLVGIAATQTLTNKTLTDPILSPTATTGGKIEFLEGTNNGTNKATLIGPASTADVTITLPALSGTVALTSTAQGAIATAGNTGSGSIGVGDTLQALGTTNEINVDAAGSALSFSLADDISGIESISTTGLKIVDNNIQGTQSNANVVLVPNGTGAVEIRSNLTVSGTITGTIDADNATVSNIEVDNFKASAIVTEGEGIASNDNDTTLPTSAAVKDYVDNNAVSASSETTFTADVKFNTGVEEKFATVTGASGVTALDCNNGHVFYKTGCTGDITANFTNLGLTAEYATNLTVIINQGGTPYEVTAVQIGGAAQTLNWQGGSAPTGNANGIDAFSFTILNDGGTYVVLGQMVDFT
jgi:hypothetical protein